MPEEHRVAVAVIHGMGSQGDRPQAANAVSFSRDLYAGLRKRMGATRFDTLVGWREIFWPMPPLIAGRRAITPMSIRRSTPACRMPSRISKG